MDQIILGFKTEYKSSNDNVHSYQHHTAENYLYDPIIL
jgi:hypothetical protein